MCKKAKNKPRPAKNNYRDNSLNPANLRRMINSLPYGSPGFNSEGNGIFPPGQTNPATIRKMVNRPHPEGLVCYFYNKTTGEFKARPITDGKRD